MVASVFDKPRLGVVSHTKERIYYHLRKQSTNVKRGREKRSRRECPKQATPNNQSVKLLQENNRMPPQVLRNLIDEIYGYICKRKNKNIAPGSTWPLNMMNTKPVLLQFIESCFLVVDCRTLAWT